MNMADQKNILRGEQRRAEPMARHTSWRAGGSAEHAYFPADLEDLRRFIGSLPEGEPVCLVGLGSNLLVRDGGLRGTVIFTHPALKELRWERNAIYAQGGVPSPKVARFTALHGMAGAEFMAGIPGTVGGALAMNAGCYGGETWAIVESVTTVDRAGQLHERTPDHYEIGYRHALLREHREEWFAAARFKLATGDGAKSRNTIRELLERRIASQPLNLPNAGSVFRNPENDHAARLIEACGLKGRVQGGAMISDKHANFIVNMGEARAADIEALIELAHASVLARFNVNLVREVRIVGDRA